MFEANNNQLFKNKFAIGLYDDEDGLVVLVDNVNQLAEFLNQSVGAAYRVVQKYKDKPMRYAGKNVTVHLIDVLSD